MGLSCKQKRKFSATTYSAHSLPVTEHLLGQVFAPTKPNEVWTGDITYIATDEGWRYLAGLKDVFTCEIVGYAMGERMTTGLVSKALFRAVQQKMPPVGLIHHTDRCSQYCAKAYRALQVQFWCSSKLNEVSLSMKLNALNGGVHHITTHQPHVRGSLTPSFAGVKVMNKLIGLDMPVHQQVN